MLFPNETAILQCFLFLLTYFILSRTLFRPFLEAIERREAATEGTVAGVPELESRIVKAKADLAQATEQLRAEGSKLRQQAVQAAIAERDRAVAEARRKADDIRAKGDRDTAQAIKDLQGRLAPVESELIDTISRKVMGQV